MSYSKEVIEVIGGIDFDPEALYAKYQAERAKRERSDGLSQYVDTEAEFSNFAADPHADPNFSRAPVFDEVECAIVGGGFGGLLMSYRLRQAGFQRVRIVENGADFGGTWYWNRYPGAQCDVESYCYLPLLEELGYMPTLKYSFGDEIFEHARRIARHVGAYELGLLQTNVTDLRWDEAAERWIVSTDRGDRFKAQFLVVANGLLSVPKLPNIPGLQEFEGHTFHTSRWDYDYTGGNGQGGLTGLEGKRVGVVGTGATAIQCVPYLARYAGELYVFQRTPSSVDVRNNAPTDPAWFSSQPAGWQSRRQENFNTLVAGGEQDEDLVNDGWTDIFRLTTGKAAREAEQRLGRPLTSRERSFASELADYKKMNQVRARAEALVNDPATAEALKPWYRQFCKRPCFNDEYLQTFNQPNVFLVDTQGKGIQRMTKTGLVVGDREYPLDCLIFATGFDVAGRVTAPGSYDITGRDGVTLRKHWEGGTRTYHGLMAHGFPNFFLMGLNQWVITISITQGLDEQAKHAAYIAGECRKRGASAVEPTAEAEQAYVDEANRLSIRNSRFFRECTPGYYNSEGEAGNLRGVNSNLYGATPMQFFAMLAAWRSTGKLEGLELE